MNQVKIYLPPPTNWQDFQKVTKRIALSRYDHRTVVEYGTLFQRQNGVDVYAEDLFGKKIGIQCKESKDELTEAEVRKEAKEALGFNPALDHFIVATTAKTEAKLQAAVIGMNQAKDFPFKIRVEFWDDLMDDINRYAMVLNECYDSYRSTFQRNDESKHLACLRIAFDRRAFKDDFLHERSYDDFEEALATTLRLFRTGFTVDRWSQIPVVQTVPLDFLPNGPYRKFVTKIEGRLEKIYTSYLADRKQILGNPQYAQERSGHYNILRRKLLTELNRRLVDSGLSGIQFAY